MRESRKTFLISGKSPPNWKAVRLERQRERPFRSLSNSCQRRSMSGAEEREPRMWDMTWCTTELTLAWLDMLSVEPPLLSCCRGAQCRLSGSTGILEAAGSGKWLRTFSFKWRTDSHTDVSKQALDAFGSSKSFCSSLLTWASALRATLATRTWRPAGVALTPSQSQSFGAVVALITSVSAATPPTRKSTRWPSSSLNLLPARSRSTKIAKAKPTMPRKPPHVMISTSFTGTLWPQELRIGLSISNITKRMNVTAMYTTNAQKQSLSAPWCIGIALPVSMPARQKTKVLPIVSMTCQNSCIALRSTNTGHIFFASTRAAITVLNTPEMWQMPSAMMKDQYAHARVREIWMMLLLWFKLLFARRIQR
mmetsp:Transcript_70728/g.205047  ORF Transcript_70728/g.205047 Transcript_70728/m.205047 type:complete len:366 (+) Transcript_70728:1254-2351(+)